jgi:2-phospho-L-lactate/phosphoenolpyruvate guanylyltransferase
MKTVLLPVKAFGKAKQRLAPALDAPIRSGLARAMLIDVLSALRRARTPERIVVFTAAHEVLEMVEPLGFQTIVEKSVDGHSAAVNQLIQEFLATSSKILAIAGDLPTLSSAEVDFALNAASEPVTLFPSRDWTGTNGVVFIPPAHIAMEYGEGSFRRHLSKASVTGLQADVMDLPGIAFDIDTPEDLQAFMDSPRKDSETWRYMTRTITDRTFSVSAAPRRLSQRRSQ